VKPRLAKELVGPEVDGLASLPELILFGAADRCRLIACTMTMDLLGIAHHDLIDGVEPGGAAMFFGEANESNGAFFI